LKEAIDSSLDHLRPWMPWAHNEPEDLNSKVERLRKWRGLFDLSQDFFYGIFSRDEARVVGGTGLHTRQGPGIREIGYWVRSDSINRGFVTEASSALTRVAFEVDAVARVEIRCDEKNFASAAIPRKLGFVHENTISRQPEGESMIWMMTIEAYPQSKAAQAKIKAFDVSGQAFRFRSYS
jgi:RimJ/RimL family protein N-acetyltransferase